MSVYTENTKLQLGSGLMIGSKAQGSKAQGS